MGRRILYVAYFYPPSRDTGMLRSAAMVKWLRRLGHEVTVLTTSAYGDDGAEDVVRTADVQSWRARRQGRESIGALFDSPTYSGRPHPLSRVLVPEALVAAWLPFARSRALALARLRSLPSLGRLPRALSGMVAIRKCSACWSPRHDACSIQIIMTLS